MTEQEAVKHVLEALIPAIDRIDNDCGHCIQEFIDVANKQLKDVGLMWRYKFVNTEEKFGAEVTDEYV